MLVTGLLTPVEGGLGGALPRGVRESWVKPLAWPGGQGRLTAEGQGGTLVSFPHLRSLRKSGGPAPAPPPLSDLEIRCGESRKELAGVTGLLGREAELFKVCSAQGA